MSENPACPKCQRVPDDDLDAASDLSWNYSDDGEKETVTCPKCEAVYTVTQHVQRIVTRTAEIKTQP